MSSQYGELQPTNGWDRFVSLGHPSKFQQVSRLGVVTAPTSLNGRQSNFARCLAVSWAGTVYTLAGAFLPKGIFTGAKFTLRPNLAFSYISSVTARHTSTERQPNFAALSRGRYLYSAGRPSRWASAHILVFCYLVDHTLALHKDDDESLWGMENLTTATRKPLDRSSPIFA